MLCEIGVFPQFTSEMTITVGQVLSLLSYNKKTESSQPLRAIANFRDGLQGDQGEVGNGLFYH